MHLLWFDVKSVKGWKKKGKDEEINGEVIRPFGQEKKNCSPRVWGLGALEELREWEQAKEKRKIERVRENTPWEREQWVKKKRKVFFF